MLITRMFLFAFVEDSKRIGSRFGEEDPSEVIADDNVVEAVDTNILLDLPVFLRTCVKNCRSVSKCFNIKIYLNNMYLFKNTSQPADKFHSRSCESRALRRNCRKNWCLEPTDEQESFGLAEGCESLHGQGAERIGYLLPRVFGLWLV
jgi:hypothetical protein